MSDKQEKKKTSQLDTQAKMPQTGNHHQHQYNHHHNKKRFHQEGPRPAS